MTSVIAFGSSFAPERESDKTICRRRFIQEFYFREKMIELNHTLMLLSLKHSDVPIRVTRHRRHGNASAAGGAGRIQPDQSQFPPARSQHLFRVAPMQAAPKHPPQMHLN
jgi:hypothetical protein